ncbi:hypothetical protein WAI453_002640 [Rhynchosporium graminicola]
MRSSGLIALMTFGLGAFAGKAPLGAAGDRCQNRPDCISGICNPDPTSGTGKSCRGSGNIHTAKVLVISSSFIASRKKGRRYWSL